MLCLPIVTAMARALFVSVWADNEEENGRTYSGSDLMDVAPVTPDDARDLALTLYGKIEQASRMNMWALLAAARRADGNTADDADYAESFGTISQ